MLADPEYRFILAIEEIVRDIVVSNGRPDLLDTLNEALIAMRKWRDIQGQTPIEIRSQK